MTQSCELSASPSMALIRTILAFLVLPSLCYSQMMYGVQVGYTINHKEEGSECYRTCRRGDRRKCKFTFTVSDYAAMNGACGDCPFNTSACYNDGCITAGGYQRNVECINTHIPGTPIRVCKDDTIEVELQNMMTSKTVTIHWHGIHQRGTPEMDGVPFVTQCPIDPNNKFTYKFKAAQAGTHLYHSHVGFEESDGVFGVMIVRRPEKDEPNSKLYDYDLKEHECIIWHWFPDSAKETFNLGRFLRRRVNGIGLIINGKGAIKSFERNDETFYTPREVFKVKKGYRYRFRFVYNCPMHCAIQVSIQGHKLIVINTDTGNVEPVEVDSLMINAGERYDIVLKADKAVDNYWMYVVGYGFCAVNNVTQQAIIRYEGAPDKLPSGTPTYEGSKVPGKILNPISVKNTNFSNNELIPVGNLNSVERNSYFEDISRKPDRILYLGLTLNVYSTFEMPGPYPQLNENTYRAPPIPFLTQREEFSSSMYCTDENRNEYCNEKDFCSCPYVINIRKGDLVECVIYEPFTATAADHPFHLHGFEFHVVAMGICPSENQTTEYVKYINENGLIKKRFKGAPLKDTLSIPNGGFGVIRFVADNPGFWLFHCHLTNHMEMGMAVVIKVGENYQMPPVPRNFPRCGNYPPTKTFVWWSDLIKTK